MNFEDIITQYGKTLDLQISIISNDKIEDVIYKSNIKSVSRQFSCELLKSCTKYIDVTLIGVYDLKGKEINIKLGAKIDEQADFVYKDLGNYIIDDNSISTSVATHITKFTAYDYMYRALTEYDLNLSFPITVDDFIKAIADRLDFIFTQGDYPNKNTLIKEDMYKDSIPTFRSVLDELSGVCGGIIYVDKNELKIMTPKNRNTIREMSRSNQKSIEINELFGPINRLLVHKDDVTYTQTSSTDEDGEINVEENEEDNSIDIDRTDEQSIATNGLNQITINNNLILNTNIEAFIDEIWDSLNGFFYYPFTIDSFGFILDPFERIKLVDEQSEYQMFVLNDTLSISDGVSEIFSADVPNVQETQYDTSSTEKKEILSIVKSLISTNAKIKYLTNDTAYIKEAFITKVDAKKIITEDLEATYAKIDMSNVSVESVGKLFVDSGLLKDVTIVDGHVTGDLTGVRIHGDLIYTNTLKVKNLLLEGPDGLIYQINALASGLTQTELTEEIYNQKMLGSVLVNQSVTTEQLNTKEIFSNSAVIAQIFAQDVTATGTVTGMIFRGGNININDKFIVDSLGNMKSVNGEFSGKIDALSGSIGGFSIENNSLEVDILKTIDGTLNRKQFILDASKNVIFFRSYRPASSDIEYGPGEEIRISHKGFEMESGTYGGKIDYYVSLDYESLGFDGDMCNASYGVNGIDIYDNSDIEAGIKSTTIDANKIITHGYIRTNSGLYTGGKTSAVDGKAGGTLGTNGYLHLVADKAKNNPGISFYYDLSKTATHQLAARQNDFYFSKPVTVNGVIRTSNTSAFGTFNSKGTAGNLIYCSSDDRVIIGTSATDVYGNTDIYAGDFMKFHANSNSDSYKATALELFREQSDNHRTVLRPATNSGAYLGTTTYRFNTAFFTNAITASDLKEKDVIEDFDFKVKDFIMGLKPIAYRRKGKGDTGERIHIGLGAQTLASHIKDLNLGDLSMVQASIIDGENEKSYHGEDIDDSKLSWGINYTELTPYLILMIKEQQNEINSLKKEINEIKQIILNKEK